MLHRQGSVILMTSIMLVDSLVVDCGESHVHIYTLKVQYTTQHTHKQHIHRHTPDFFSQWAMARRCHGERAGCYGGC